MKLADKINKSHLGKRFKIIHKSGYEFTGTILFNKKNELIIGGKFGGYLIGQLDIWNEIKEV